MGRTKNRPEATRLEQLRCQRTTCIACGKRTWADYKNYRTVTTRHEIVRLELQIRRCHNQACGRYLKPCRPECEGRWALPEHEFGLDVVVWVGTLRYREKRTREEIYRALNESGVEISERSVTNMLNRYDEVVAAHLENNSALQAKLEAQGQVVLGIDGLQPEVGHEVLWVVRECLSGEILLARPMVSSAGDELAGLFREIADQLPVPVMGIVSDGERGLRRAIEQVWPDVPHGLCHFHYLKEAVRPMADADRHAKKLLKKAVRNIRPLERATEKDQSPWRQVIDGYLQAVRAALTDDGHPPLDAAGLRLRRRLQAIRDSLVTVAKKRPSPSC